MILIGILLITVAVVASTKGTEIVDYVDEKTASWTKYDGLFKKYGEKYKIPWQWLKAFALVESDLGRYPSVAHGIKFPKDVEKSTSQDGLSWGLMQVVVSTAKDFDKSANAEKLNDPEYSVNIACQYINFTKKYFTESDPRYVEWIVKSYNQGAGNTLKELSGKTKGYTGDYFQKWTKQLARVMES